MKLKHFVKEEGREHKDILTMYSNEYMDYFWSLRDYPETLLEKELATIKKGQLQDIKGCVYPVTSYGFVANELNALLQGIEDFCKSFHKQIGDLSVIFMRQKFLIEHIDDQYKFFTRIGVLSTAEKAIQCLKYEGIL